MLTLYWTCAAAIVIAQVMILRSTRRAFRGPRGMKGGRPVDAGAPADDAGGAPRAQSPALEWSFAVGPALGLILLLILTWRAATRPPVMEVRFDGTTISALHAPGAMP